MIVKKGLESRYKAIISEHMYIDQDGYLVCLDAILGRAGVYKYIGKSLGLNTDEVIEVYRDEDEVFADESLKSLEHRPITINHPDEEVTIDNVKRYAKGEVYNIRRDGNNIIGDLIIKDRELKEKILNKEVKELSLGYRQDLIYEEDTKLYKLKNIIYNHLAFVKKGRAGNAMVLDGIESIEETKEEKEEVVEDACSKDEEEVVEEKTETETEDEEVKEEVATEDETETKEEVEEDKEEKEEEVVEDTAENETLPREDEKEKVDNHSTQTPTNDLSEVEEKEETKKDEEKDTMVKDSAYFLDKQKEIAKIEDKNLKEKMSLILDNEMNEFLNTQQEEKADIVCDTEEEKVEEKVEPTISYEERMQEYYNRFNPKYYNDPDKALAFYKSECKNNNAKKFD